MDLSMKTSEGRPFEVLETTLRDGSYAIDFKFTAHDTSVLCKELEKAGFGLIEIGHGVGLGASDRGYGKAAESDEDYLKAAAEALTTSKFGMFCIPGIANLEHVDIAADYGMDFIRIGTNVTEMEEAEPYVARAKKRGMMVSANFMKSYAMKPGEFAEKAVLTQKYGSDVLCVVDSAGGMLPDELVSYFTAVQDACDIPLAFHGHNNLGLAVSHSLKAVEMGAVIVDSSLQGLGRSAGNAATELLVAVFDRLTFDLGVDPLIVMDIGERFIKPLVRKKGISSLDTVTGLAQFHSSYMGIIRKYAGRYGVDPRRLIIELCEKDKVNADESLVESIAKSIPEKVQEPMTTRYGLADYYGSEQQDMK